LGIALFAGSWLWALGRAGRTIFRLRDDLSGLIVDKIPEALARLAEEAGLAGQLHLFVSPAKQAFTAGFLRPRVYLSTSLLEALDREELLAVLFHEAHHLVRRDPSRIFLATILKDAFWYLPVVRALWREFTEAKEKAADDAAARAGEIPLAGALLKLAAGNHAAASAQVPAFHGPSIEERVRRLLAPGTDRSPRPAWRSVAASLLIAVSLLGSVAAPSWSSSTTDSCTMAHCPMPHAGELSGAECRHHCEANHS
jgi:Zn-dependent protease with chaperone function